MTGYRILIINMEKVLKENKKGNDSKDQNRVAVSNLKAIRRHFERVNSGTILLSSQSVTYGTEIYYWIPLHTRALVVAMAYLWASLGHHRMQIL